MRRRAALLALAASASLSCLRGTVAYTDPEEGAREQRSFDAQQHCAEISASAEPAADGSDEKE